MMKFWEIIDSLDQLNEHELKRLRSMIDNKLKKRDLLGYEESSIVERRDYQNGVLQLEYRANKKTGTRRGPYWYFKYRQGGRQHTEYIGSEENLEEWKVKRAQDNEDHPSERN